MDLLNTAFECQLNVLEKEETDKTANEDEGAAAPEEPCASSLNDNDDHIASDDSSNDNHCTSDADDTVLDSTPLRDSSEQTNAQVLRDIRLSDTHSVRSASTATSVAPEVIRERVKRQMKSKEKAMQTRRIRKHGEAAVQTKQRRENRYDIVTSLDAGWY